MCSIVNGTKYQPEMKRFYFLLTTLLLATCSIFATNISKQAVDTVNTVVAGKYYGTMDFSNLLAIKVMYTYDANGNQTAREEHMINSSAVMAPMSRIDNTFEFNQLQLSIISQWNSTSSTFEEKKREVYQYPEANTQLVYKYTGSTLAGWTLTDSLKKVSTLNSNLDTTLILTFGAVSPGIWAEVARDDRTYDISNRIVESVIQVRSGSVWVNSNKLSYSYNGDNKTGLVSIKTWNGSAWVEPAYTFPNVTITSTAHQMVYSTYDVTIASVQNKKQINVQPYPNPTSEGFYINAGDEVVKVSVFTLSGVLILEKEDVTGNEYITSTLLTNGTYLIKIENDKNVFIKKLLVK